MYIDRILERDILKYLGKKEIIAIIGPRQSGKTTLMKNIFGNLKNAVFLDFEDRETLEMFNEDIRSFIDLYVKKLDPPTIIIKTIPKIKKFLSSLFIIYQIISD